MTANSASRLPRLWKALGLAFSSRHYFGYACKVAAGCLTKSGRASFRRNLMSLSLPPPGNESYPTWIRERLAKRAETLPAPGRDATAGKFSFLTTVYDTAPRYLHALHRSLQALTVTDFEWVLLDNGSSERGTLAALAQLRADPRVVYLHAPTNLGIIGGMRRCLETATGEWFLPLDSDDLIYPDTLALFAAAIARDPAATIWYSDEDKIRDDEVPFDPFHKPGWDPVLFVNSCYTSHLCCIGRTRALELDAYGDSRAEGCHDWDTFFRFSQAGDEPRHLPEITYSWRMHAGSCAGNMFSKDYIVDSHRYVLRRNLEQTTPRPELFEITRSPMFAGVFDWWIRRKHVQPRPVELIRVGSERPRADLATREFGDPNALLAIVSDQVDIVGDDEWRWEAIGIFERFPDAAIVGGRIYDASGAVWSAGEVLDFGGDASGPPDRGRHPDDPGYFATVRRQRSARSVSHLMMIVRGDAWHDLIAELPDLSHPGFGLWLAARATELGRRVVYSPFVQARLRGAAPASLDDREARLLRGRFPEFFAIDPFYSPHLSRTTPFALDDPAAATRRHAARGLAPTVAS